MLAWLPPVTITENPDAIRVVCYRLTATWTPTLNCQLADSFRETYGVTKHGSGRRQNSGSYWLGVWMCVCICVCERERGWESASTSLKTTVCLNSLSVPPPLFRSTCTVLKTPTYPCFVAEVNILWAGHQTHHSSEDYNLSTALRQSAVHRYFGWVNRRRFFFFLGGGRGFVYFGLHSLQNSIVCLEQHISSQDTNCQVCTVSFDYFIHLFPWWASGNTQSW